MEKNVEQYKAFKKGVIKMPDHLALRKEMTAPLFKNKFMEKLTRTSIFTPIIMHCTISSFLLWNGLTHYNIPTIRAIVLVFCGFVFWTFAEYITHRFLYHTESNSRFLFNLQHKAHGIHHQHPKDPTRLAMPPVPGLLLSAVFFLIFWLVMGMNVLAFFPGFILGYCTYISMHYAQHVIKSPKWKPFRLLWKHHAVHHYIDPYVAHGVSTRLWDLVFGTMPQKDVFNRVKK